MWRQRFLKFLSGSVILPAGLGAVMAAPAQLLKNIQVTVGASLEPKDFCEIGSEVFFTAATEGQGRELWRTDGTEAGTRLVRDVYPGLLGSEPRELVVSGGRLFFTANDGVHGRELWLSDGTTEGTRRVADLNPGSGEPDIAGLRAFKSGVIFYAYLDENECIYYSDGSENGTRMVRSLTAKGLYLNGQGYKDWVVAGGKLIFRAYSDQGVELWQSNGTAAGTSKLKLVELDGLNYNLTGMAAVGSTVYFAADTAVHGVELWKTNGTPAGTVLAKDLIEGEQGSSPEQFTVLNGQVFFTAANENGTRGIWRTDGTAAGTQRVAGVPGGNAGSGPEELTAAGGVLYFKFPAASPRAGELWMAQGSPPVAVMVRQVEPDKTGVVISGLTSGEDQLFFRVNSVEEGSDLWVSDSSFAGTRRARDMVPGAGSGLGASLKAVGGVAYFEGTDNGMSRGLWRSDGTEGGTVLVKNAVGDSGSDPRNFRRVGGRVFFHADDGVHGRELWRTDGTEEGTVLVKDVRPGVASGVGSAFELLGALDDRLLIFRADSGAGVQLWQSDGTESGTVPLSDPRILPEHVLLSGLTAFDDRVFYAVGGRLWCAQGMNAPEMTGAATQVTGGFAQVNAGVLFAGQQGGAGRELWRSDGTVAGTFQVKDIYIGSSSSQPSELTTHLGQCYFLAGSSSGQGLWKSDGTAGGTTAVSLGSIIPYRLSATGSGLYIVGMEVVNEIQYLGLWMLKPGVITPVKLVSWHPNENVSLRLLDVLEETLFFSMRRQQDNPVLWSTQGAPQNTRAMGGGGVELPRVDAEIALFPDLLVVAQVHESAGLEPHGLALLPSWSLSVVNVNGSERVLSAGEAVAMARQHPMSDERLRLRVRNTGYQPMMGVQAALSEDAEGVFSLEGAGAADLAPGASLDFSVVINAHETGAFEALVTLSHGGGMPVPFSIRVLGSIVAKSAPEFRQRPESRLVLSGHAISLSADFLAEEPVTASWLKNGRAIPGAVPLVFPAVAPADAGSYTLKLSNAKGNTSAKASLAVVRQAPPVAIYLDGETLAFSCVVDAPAGTKLSYQWYSYGLALSDAGRFSGSRTARLRVSGLSWGDEGIGFDCRVTLHSEGSSEEVYHGTTRALVAELPIIDPDFYLSEIAIGEEVNETIPTLNFASRFTASGLPPGVRLNEATGQLSGRPTQSLPVRYNEQQPYQVKVTAYNKAGRSDTVTVDWYVLTLVPPGRHEGLLDRKVELDEGRGLGSRVTLNATTQGVLSGRLYHEGRSFSFRSSLSAMVQHPVLGEVVGISVKRTAALPPLTLWVGTSYQNLGTLGLSDDQGVLVTGSLKLSSFQGRDAPFQHLGRYTVAFQAAVNLPTPGLPEGHGYVVVTITNSGYARWTGQLADGVKLSGSSLVCGWPTSDETQYIPVYALPYQGLGSLRGWVNLDAVVDYVEFIEARGTLDWMRQAVPESSRDRAYRAGIPLHMLNVQGGRYVAPLRDEVVFRLFDEPNNARMVLSGGGLASPIVRTVTLTSVDSGAGGKRRVELVPVWEGMTRMTLLVNAEAGTFSGELRWTDFDPTAPLYDVLRVTKMQGVLLPNQGMAAGHFVLPQLPMLGPPPTTPANSPVVSGRVELTAANGTLSPEFVSLPTGIFQLGDSLSEGSSDELPLRSVTLNPFVIQKKEVTLEQWREVMAWALKNGYDFDNQGSARGMNHPVQGINWYDAVKWCNARSEMERREPCYYSAAPFTSDRVYRSGRVDLDNSQFYFSNGPFYTGNGYRLPTEAEWERAARGGVNGGRFPQGATLSHGQANYFADPNASALTGIDVSLTPGPHPVFGARGVTFSAPVGSFSANSVGLYDMSGNVSEWCWDWYVPFTAGPVTNPRVGDKPVTDPKRVLRGGSGQSGAMQVRAAARDAAAPDAVAPSVGFRVVRRGL